MKLITKLKRTISELFRGFPNFAILMVKGTKFPSHNHSILIVKFDTETLTPMELVYKTRLCSILILEYVLGYKDAVHREFEEIETKTQVIRTYSDNDYQLTLITYKQDGSVVISILENN